jgi:hypothetical protein
VHVFTDRCSLCLYGPTAVAPMAEHPMTRTSDDAVAAYVARQQAQEAVSVDQLGGATVAAVVGDDPPGLPGSCGPFAGVCGGEVLHLVQCRAV